MIPRFLRATTSRASAFRLLGALLAGVLLAPVAAPRAEVPTADPLAQLIADLAAIPGLEAHFSEEKRLALLEEPLVSEGSLYYARPDRLRRSVEQPVRSTLVLRGAESDPRVDGHVRVMDPRSVLHGDVAQEGDRLEEVAEHLARQKLLALPYVPALDDQQRRLLVEPGDALRFVEDPPAGSNVDVVAGQRMLPT